MAKIEDYKIRELIKEQMKICEDDADFNWGIGNNPAARQNEFAKEVLNRLMIEFIDLCNEEYKKREPSERL